MMSRQSIAYWLHLYRRTGMGVTGRNNSPATIYNVRAIFEAAVQKYGRRDICTRVAISTEVAPGEIFQGLLLSAELSSSLAVATAFPQLVLTEFGVNEMREFYDTEKLAYEVWKSMATLRMLGKGPSLVVDSGGEYFYDNRSEELNALVVSYDDRARALDSSATGTVFQTNHVREDNKGYVLVPIYNMTKVEAKHFEEWFKHFGIGFSGPADLAPNTNFIWLPFNLKGYYFAHEPFSDGFEKKHGIPLSWVMAAIAGLFYRVLAMWQRVPGRVAHFWQRAYEGPTTLESVVAEIREWMPAGIEILGLPLDAAEIDVERICRFLSLTDSTREAIDVGLAGPHSMILPFGSSRVFVDYAWCHRLLYNLFFGIKIDSRKDFKGVALEKVVHQGKSKLPTQACHSTDGSSRQIDAAFALGDTLVICECKAVWRSFGVEKGDPASIEYRNREVVERALAEADEKSRWLSHRPVGTNYDISQYRYLIPVGISPFVEYIPSLRAHYWLKDGLPRVLTPGELSDFLSSAADPEFRAGLSNRIQIRDVASSA